MNNITYSFLLTTLAGLSTVLGFMAIFIKGNKNKIIGFSLSFASGVMATICLIDLIPSSFNYFNNYYLLFRCLLILLCITIGFFISSLFERYIPTYNNSNLYKIGFLTLMGIIVHNIPEGIVTFMVSQIDRKIGLSLAISISLHNIPEGISIAIPFYYATKNKVKTFLLVLLAGCSELFGGLITWIFLNRFITNSSLGIIFGIIAGIMINIGLFNLLKEGYNYHKKLSIIGLITGMIVMLISHYYI